MPRTRQIATRARRAPPTPPRKIFKPQPWFEHVEPSYYINHILMELGRLVSILTTSKGITRLTYQIRSGTQLSA